MNAYLAGSMTLSSRLDRAEQVLCDRQRSLAVEQPLATTSACSIWLPEGVERAPASIAGLYRSEILGRRIIRVAPEDA